APGRDDGASRTASSADSLHKIRAGRGAPGPGGRGGGADPAGRPPFRRLAFDGRSGVWRSLVARSVRVGEVPGSNPGTPIDALPGRVRSRGSPRPLRPAD